MRRPAIDRLLPAIFCFLFAMNPAGAGAGPQTAGQAAQEPATQSEPGVTFQDRQFLSKSLGREMPYRVLLPADYERRKDRVAVIYFLHGFGGEYRNLYPARDIAAFIRRYHVLFVMPEAKESWYTNSATTPADRYEDYVARDLIAEIDGHFRTLAERKGRAILGLSMGGYGAVKLGLKYPSEFAAVGSLSGYFSATEVDDKTAAGMTESLQKAFGPRGGAARAENDVFQIAEKVNPRAAPYFFIACGTDDALLETDREFVRRLRQRGFAVDYQETPGGHDLDYWLGEVHWPLAGFARRMKLKGK